MRADTMMLQLGADAKTAAQATRSGTATEHGHEGFRRTRVHSSRQSGPPNTTLLNHRGICYNEHEPNNREYHPVTSASTIILLPFIVAFLVFVTRFYSRERAASMTNLSFLLAVMTILTAGLYLGLGVVDLLPVYGTIGFGVTGLIFLTIAISRMFMM
jgi:hypothetical protein